MTRTRLDVRALLPDDSILNATALDTFREYNTEQMTQVKSPNNTHEAREPVGPSRPRLTLV